MPKLQNHVMVKMSSKAAYYESIDPKFLKTIKLSEAACYRGLKSNTLVELAHFLYNNPTPDCILGKLFSDVLLYACGNAEVQNIPGWEDNMIRLLELVMGLSSALGLFKITTSTLFRIIEAKEFHVKNLAVFVYEG
jgi:hypothetical protein